MCGSFNISEHIKFVIQLLEKATKSSSRAYLGFSVIDVVDGISQLAVNESNNRQASLDRSGTAVDCEQVHGLVSVLVSVSVLQLYLTKTTSFVFIFSRLA